VIFRNIERTAIFFPVTSRSKYILCATWMKADRMRRLERGHDPIAPELLRTRLEAIGQEAGAAVEQTAISPIVTESKDYSVTLCDADGSVISATGVAEIHFGAAMHAVRSTIAAHGDSVAPGDVFIANDPHSGGGVHPQDVVIQRPVFCGGERVAWIALAAHMMDMGGMVPGSSAPAATECYQEALRLPPVRLMRQGEEAIDVWEILRINIRSAHLVEMDIRSLVVGGAVAEAKLVQLVGETGVADFRAAAAALIRDAERVLRERISALEDGRYLSVGRVEFRDGVLKTPCELIVSGDRLTFDLSGAPAQVPHFINSKAYILRALIAPRLRQLLAPGLPFNQSAFDVIEMTTRSGTIADSVSPAPIAAAHMDAASAMVSAAEQCLHLALHASPWAAGRRFLTAQPPASYGVGRWNYLDESGERRVFTLLDGSFCGSPAGWDRDGLDIVSNLTPGGMRLEYADVEILEAAYPLLFRHRDLAAGVHGYGRFRSGEGCREGYQPHHVDDLVGALTGTRAWFPISGAAGGLPGAMIRYALVGADGGSRPLPVQASGVRIAPGEYFEMLCASGGGFGDPLDREPSAVVCDLEEGRLDAATAQDVYGLVFAAGGAADLPATERRRDELRRARLAHAQPARRPVPREAVASGPEQPLYPGVVQRGGLAIAEASGAVLATAPDNWLDGCPTLETCIDERAGGVTVRAHLDPASGRLLFVDVVSAGDGPSIQVLPDRWAKARRARQALPAA
jgi:N-methylhydantoinase B